MLRQKTGVIDATYLKAHRTASSLRVIKGDLGRLIGRTRGSMNTKLHAAADANGRPLKLLHDHRAGQRLHQHSRAARRLRLQRHWFRNTLQAKGIQPCIPGRRSRNDAVRYDKCCYGRPRRIEIMFGRLKDWRRVAPTTIVARPPSSPKLRSLPLSSSGGDQRVLILTGHLYVAPSSAHQQSSASASSPSFWD